MSAMLLVSGMHDKTIENGETDFMESDTINAVAMMTGLTARTRRNYLKLGLLNGEKENGMWRFTAGDLRDFIAHPSVKPAIQAKNKAVVFDFPAEDTKRRTGFALFWICILMMRKRSAYRHSFARRSTGLTAGT